MAKQSRDWSEILVRRGVIGPDQLNEAKRMGNSPLEEALSKLGYATPEEVAKAKAEQYGLDFVALQEIEIPADGGRTGARVAGPRKHRDAAGAGEWRDQGHHA